MRVLVTGSRDWTDARAVASVLGALDTMGGPHVLIHGACRGLDLMAAQVARRLGWTVESHPADWATHGKAAGPLRNQEMVNTGADICLAFPLPESRGTRDCMERARLAGIPVKVPAGLEGVTGE